MTVSINTIEPIDYAERWRQIVEVRRVYLDNLYARLGRTTENYWASRADFFRPSLRRELGPDPFLKKVLEFVTPETTVLDVGAGAGRYAVPLAQHARKVVAVEPAPPMVQALREEVEHAGLRNLHIVVSDWENAAVDPADVVICSHVIYPISEVVPFLRKLDAKTKQVCLLHLNTGQPSWEMPELWLRFHPEPVPPQPTYIDAYNLLHQLGIYANVMIVSFVQRGPAGGMTQEEAVERFRERLVLDDSTETTERLRAALREVLVETPQGWQMPPRPVTTAIIWWTPEQRIEQSGQRGPYQMPSPS